MKINWGTAIVLAMILFMGFILYLVVTMTTNTTLDHDLVTEEYYKQELDFQDKLDKRSNYGKLPEKIKVRKTSRGYEVNFPDGIDFTAIEGKIFLYRPSNKQLDLEIPLSLTSRQMLIPDMYLAQGRWNIAIDWTLGKESYYFEEQFTY